MSIYEASHQRIALKHPMAALQFKMGNKHALHAAIIIESANYLWGKNIDLSLWKKALDELEKETLIPANKDKNNVVVGNNLNTTFGKWIYCCVRVLQPETIIETGVAHGYSSWIILNALNKNKKGKLYSIDLPNNDTNKDYNFQNQPTTGWLVPDTLRSRWEMHLGDAKILLPKILNKLGSLDMFFHDSDHSFEHMQYEFNTVHPFMKKEGIILSDDVHKNAAFAQYTEKNNLSALQFNKGGCALIY